MFGIGKPRTKLGKWIDKNNISQQDLTNWSGISRPTITKLCGVMDYEPTAMTKRSLVHALQRHGYSVRPEDFWSE
jgi:predicted XRE-type DNA-binding protein